MLVKARRDRIRNEDIRKGTSVAKQTRCSSVQMIGKYGNAVRGKSCKRILGVDVWWEKSKRKTKKEVEGNG